MKKKLAAIRNGTERSAETGTEYRDRNEVATGFEITAGAVEN